MKWARSCAIILCFISTSLIINGCASQREVATKYKKTPEVKTQRIGLMPFLKGKYYSNIDDHAYPTLNCRLNRLCFNDDNLQGNADETLTRFMWNSLEKKFGDRLIPLYDAMELYKRFLLTKTLILPVPLP